jgi:hypothetical protein
MVPLIGGHYKNISCFHQIIVAFYRGPEPGLKFASVTGNGSRRFTYVDGKKRKGIADMKKLLIVGFLVMSIAVSASAQTFDGIWQIDGQSAFFSIHQNTDLIVGITYIPGTGESAFIGAIRGNGADIYYWSGLVHFLGTAVMDSPNACRILISDCDPFPGQFCLFPIGSVLRLTRVF